MNEEIDDGDFYHHDFTTASEWEIFIARMEEILHEWKLQDAKNDSILSSVDNEWHIKSEQIHFADVQFNLSHYKYLKKDVRKLSLDDNNEKEIIDTFNPNFDFILYNGRDNGYDYSLFYWYGLHHFITLTTSSNLSINNESQIKILLSSINIVISNSGWDVPMFVQIREKWQRCYQGVQEVNGIRTNFEMIHLRKGPQHCKYLTGLLDLFKTKISSLVPLEPVSVSVRLSFILNNWMSNTWPNDTDIETLDIFDVVKLQFGVNRDPIQELVLNASWSQLPEHLIVDSENYSDFDPLQAPIWTVKVKMVESPICLLSECLIEFIQLSGNNLNLRDMLGDIVSLNNPVVNNPLDILTESPVPTISTVVKKATGERKPQKKSIPIEEDTLMIILYFLFPDAQTECDKNHELVHTYENDSEVDNNCPGLKTCNPDTLVWRLSIILSQAMISLGGAKTVAYIWYEFIQEMRYRWENSILIPGVNPGFPDTRTCILHQKLQLLNCCIERKKSREQKELLLTKSDDDDFRSTDGDSEDEFYDCDVDKEEENYSKHSLWNKPVGRLSKHGNLKLIKTGEQLYIPITQEPVPKTEDQLEEDADVLLMLGTDEQGSELRARMMSASLLSDMESFKAANPDSIIEDFIRWYSPTDWIEEKELDEWGQKKGHLSTRMLISDNTWVQMWEQAKPVPANRQKRLFDDTREAEKILHYLESKSLSQILELVLPVLSHVAVYNLIQEVNEITKILPNNLLSVDDIVKSIRILSRDPRAPVHKYKTVFEEIATQELIICQIKSLMFKFNPTRVSEEPLNNCILNLVTESEILVEGGNKSYIGSRLIQMFSDVQKAVNMTGELTENLQYQNKSTVVFPQPSSREFVMRVKTERPEMQSNCINHMLRAILTKKDFRLCGAFSENIIS